MFWGSAQGTAVRWEGQWCATEDSPWEQDMLGFESEMSPTGSRFEPLCPAAGYPVLRGRGTVRRQGLPGGNGSLGAGL